LAFRDTPESRGKFNFRQKDIKKGELVIFFEFRKLAAKVILLDIKRCN
jgi:hypothetical protein